MLPGGDIPDHKWVVCEGTWAGAPGDTDIQRRRKALTVTFKGEAASKE